MILFFIVLPFSFASETSQAEPTQPVRRIIMNQKDGDDKKNLANSSGNQSRLIRNAKNFHARTGSPLVGNLILPLNCIGRRAQEKDTTPPSRLTASKACCH